MAQQVLAERFQLRLHHEQKEMLTYELTAGKSGAQLKESTHTAAPSAEARGASRAFSINDSGFPVFPAGRGGLLGLNGHFRWAAFNVTIADILKMLVLQFGAPVVDATGLTANYDIDLYWVQESTGTRGITSEAQGGLVPTDEAHPGSGPTLLRAVQEQLGLKLTTKKNLVDFVVVDHAEKVPVQN